jgi:hypothetical protein
MPPVRIVGLVAGYAAAVALAGCGDDFKSSDADSADGGGDVGCEPAELGNFSPPPYVPGRVQPGACTVGQIGQYLDCMTGNAPCEPFMSGGTLAACGACLDPTELDAAEWGPLLMSVNTTAGATSFEANVSACVELTSGSRECAEAYQAMKACERAACDANCAAASQAELEERRQCYLDARDGTCALHAISGACATLAGPVAACIGDGFEDQFIEAGTALCVNG